MPESSGVRQLCALLHGGRALTHGGRLPADDTPQRHASLASRAVMAGDPAAVLAAPQLQVGDDPVTLVSVFASRRGGGPDGTWTRVDAVAEPPDVVAALRDVAAVVAGAPAPARRPDWFRIGWYDDAERWVDAVLAGTGRRRTGPAEPGEVSCLSAVVRIPCDPGPPLWLKASTAHFRSEPALTRLAAEIVPRHAPRVVAVDDRRAWMLMEHIQGAGAEPPPGLGLVTARVAARLHVRSLAHPGAFETTDVPRRGLSATLRSFDEILVSGIELDRLTDDEIGEARAVRDGVATLLDELASYGIPDTLVHGDLHPGNVAVDGGSPVIYDWSDAAVSHPFLDLVRLTERLPEEDREAARAAYVDLWRPSHPDVDLARVLALAEPANQVFQAVTFELLCRSLEDASLWEMTGVVARILRELPGRVAAARSGGRGGLRPSDG
jgi:hypothetical protein